MREHEEEGDLHTPGPWGIEDHGPGKGYVIHAETWIVLEDGVEYREVIGAVPDGDNARLIASAPDLLEACRTVLRRLEYLQRLWGKESITNTVAEQVRAAICEAVGGREGSEGGEVSP